MLANQEPGVDEADQGPSGGVLADAEMSGETSDVGGGHEPTVWIELGVEGDV